MKPYESEYMNLYDLQYDGRTTVPAEKADRMVARYQMKGDEPISCFVVLNDERPSYSKLGYQLGRMLSVGNSMTKETGAARM